MNFLADYLPFAAKAVTIALLALLPLVLLLLVLRQARGRRDELRLTVRKLNDRLLDSRLAMEAAMLSDKAFKARVKDAHKRHKAEPQDGSRRRLFVCEFDGDLRADAVSSLREELTAILQVARPQDEVAVVLESAGGTIHGYGLAASQLQRVRDHGLRLTTLVDKIAASGGYMMACVGDELVCAPFAIVGSIGVVAQLPNFHRLLRKHDVDFELLTAGRYKRTLTMFGENTPAGREKFQAELDEAHGLFKEFVARHRPALDLDQVGTGEYWLGTRAQTLGLVDRLATSDEFLTARAAEWDVLLVEMARPRSWLERLLAPLHTALGRLLNAPPTP